MKGSWSIARCMSLVVMIGLFATPLIESIALAQSASTQTPVKGLTISPPLQEITLGSGLIEAKAGVTITNTTGQDLSADIRVVDFDTDNQFGTLAFLEQGSAASKYGLANWTRLGSQSVMLVNGQATEIPVTITNGTDLAPGGHYAAVVATVTTPVTKGVNTVSLKQELVSLIFAKKIGGETYGLQLDDLKLSNTSRLPEAVTATFKSTGNTHVIPRGYIEVRDGDNRLLMKGIINPESSAILPNKTRQVETVLQAVDPPGKSQNYTVTAFYRHDGQQKFSTQTLYIRDGITPKQRYALLAAVIVIVITGTLLFRSYILRRSSRRRYS